MADIRGKALGYLREGSVRILRAAYSGGPRRASEVLADVDGYRSTYVVTYRDGVWACTCHGSGEGCVHIETVKHVTGHDSAVAKPGRAA